MEEQECEHAQYQQKKVNFVYRQDHFSFSLLPCTVAREEDQEAY